MRMKSSSREAELRERLDRLGLFLSTWIQLCLKRGTTLGLFNISPPFFFFCSRLSCIFCHLYLEKARLINSTIYKFQETLRDSFFFWYGKHSLLLFFCQLLGFQRGLGQRMEKMWEVSVLPAPRLREPLPANYTTGVGSRAPFH